MRSEAAVSKTSFRLARQQRAAASGLLVDSALFRKAEAIVAAAQRGA
jgi:hypothetical protein